MSLQSLPTRAPRGFAAGASVGLASATIVQLAAVADVVAGLPCCPVLAMRWLRAHSDGTPRGLAAAARRLEGRPLPPELARLAEGPTDARGWAALAVRPPEVQDAATAAWFAREAAYAKESAEIAAIVCGSAADAQAKEARRRDLVRRANEERARAACEPFVEPRKLETKVAA